MINNMLRNYFITLRLECMKIYCPSSMDFGAIRLRENTTEIGFLSFLHLRVLNTAELYS